MHTNNAQSYIFQVVEVLGIVQSCSSFVILRVKQLYRIPTYYSMMVSQIVAPSAQNETTEIKMTDAHLSNVKSSLWRRCQWCRCKIKHDHRLVAKINDRLECASTPQLRKKRNNIHRQISGIAVATLKMCDVTQVPTPAHTQMRDGFR